MIDLKTFEKFAIEYDKWFDEHAIEYELELKAIRKFIPLEGEGIEIGAGTGRFIQPLGISLGIEPSDAMRTIAIRRNANIIAGKAESLPFENDSYDFALFVTADCFLTAPEIAFKEVHRILRSDGRIIVALIDKDSHLGKKYEKNKNSSKFYKHAHFHSVVEIKEKLEYVGFGHFEYVQALLPADLTDNQQAEIKPGYGEGSFVVLKAQKRS